MALRTRFESSDDVGVFSKLTNRYCLVGIGASNNFYSVFEQELQEHVPGLLQHKKCAPGYLLVCTNKRVLRAVVCPFCLFITTLNLAVIYTSVAGCRIIGRLCVGNKNGLLLPTTTTDQELGHVRNAMPDDIKVCKQG